MTRRRVSCAAIGLLRLMVCAAVGLAAGCRDAPSDVVVRDSAGVTIVENRAPATPWRTGTPWTVVPELTFGTDSGDTPLQFGQIGDVAVTHENDIVVLDQLAGELRVFDSQGRHLRSIGRAGRGPGELSRQVNTVIPMAGDSLLVPDPRERRITVFASDGTPGRVVPTTTLPPGQSWSALPDGRLVFRGLSVSRGSDGSFTFWDGLLVMAGDGTVADTLFEFDYARTDIGGPGRIKAPLIVNNPSWARLDDGRIAWTALDRTYVSIHDSTGRLTSRIGHALWTARAVTDADRAVMVELLRTKLRSMGGDAAFADSPQVEAPPRLPAITAVRAGPGGTIWVQRMGSVDTIDPMAINAADRSDFLGGATWDVLDRDGRLLGAIVVPPRFRIFRITDAAVYGATRNDAGVEQVMRLRLVR